MLVPVYDIKNCGPRHRFVANGKLVHNSDQVNMQNLPRASPLKTAFVAPPGQYIFGADLSQIELRLGLWLAGQADRLGMLAKGIDLYKDFATIAFNVAYDDVTKEQRFVGKTSNLSLIYGTGAARLREALRVQGKLRVPIEEAKRLVDLYRQLYNQVVLAWREGDRALHAILADQEMPLFHNGVVRVDGKRGIRLPSGLHIQFPNLRHEVNPDSGKAEWTFDSKNGPERTYGAKVFQGCIAEGTEVLTDRGWMPIESVQLSDKVHDGVEFVNHGGLVFKGVQPCLSIDGVLMTPDHKVLTDGGWIPASQNPEPHRPDLRHVDGATSRTQYRQETVLEVSVSVRHAVREGGVQRDQRGAPRRNSELRVCDQAVNQSEQHQARHEPSPGVRSVGLHGGALHQAFPPGVEELRGAWGQGLQTMGEVIREFLGGHGPHIPGWAAAGPRGQRRELHAKELSLGCPSTERHEQAEYRETCGRVRTEPVHRGCDIDDLLPSGTWMADQRVGAETVAVKPVFDIMNCGTRTRFVVRGTQAPFVVHNCTQAIARCIMADGLLRVQKRYPVRLTIHDAAYWLGPQESAKEQLEWGIQQLTAPVPYCPGLPLAAEGGFGPTLADC